MITKLHAVAHLRTVSLYGWVGDQGTVIAGLVPPAMPKPVFTALEGPKNASSYVRAAMVDTYAYADDDASRAAEAAEVNTAAHAATATAIQIRRDKAKPPFGEAT